MSFGDHYSQAAMFYRSLTPLEQAHIVEAFTFELGKCYEQAVKERELQVLANVDTDLCEQVAAGLGLPAPSGSPPEDVTLSPALSQVVTEPGPIAGRKIGVIAERQRRPRRDRQAPQGGGEIGCLRPGRRARRRRTVPRCPPGNRGQDAAHSAFD